MELDELLTAFDKTAANLGRLENVWGRARALLPTGPFVGGNVQYDDHERAYGEIVAALIPIDGHAMPNSIPGFEEIGRDFLDYAEIGEHPVGVWRRMEQPDKDIAEYRFHLNRARRRAVRRRLEELVAEVNASIAALRSMINDGDFPGGLMVEHDLVGTVRSAIVEVDRLVGDTVQRSSRWTDLHRHLRFAEPQDWVDIAELDWPVVLQDIERAGFDDTEPIPVEGIADLGVAAAGDVRGRATVELNWDNLDGTRFERLLFDLLSAIDGHDNVAWLLNTNAPDRGRDLSLDRTIKTPTGDVRMERVLVQAKHWRSKSLGPTDLAEAVTKAETWTPPFQIVILATSGRFTADAVTWHETRAQRLTRPDLELWPENRLESLLAQHPVIAATHGLR